MDNSYWVSTGGSHHINFHTIELMCFELLNIFEASKGIMDSRVEALEIPAINESGEIILSDEKIKLIELHKKHSFNQISKILLHLGLLVRTFDDQMKDGNDSSKYLNQLNKINKYNIGSLSGEKNLTIREACNKIIHSEKIEPQYETYDILFDNNELLRTDPPSLFGHLNGIILLTGRFGKKTWEVQLNVQNFIESLLELLHFNNQKNS